MKRLLVLLPLVVLLVGCGGKKSDNASGGSSMNCEISGDKSKANLVDLDDGKTHSVAVQTSKGDFTFDLATKISPCTTASFAGLVEKGFFDGLTFHRIVPGFVIQGGDPEGTGMGGPGYSVVDAPPQDTKYEKGLVAMAKTAERAGRDLGQPVLRRHERRRQPPARLRSPRRRHRTAWTSSRRSGSSATRPTRRERRPRRSRIDKMELKSG